MRLLTSWPRGTRGADEDEKAAGKSVMAASLAYSSGGAWIRGGDPCSEPFSGT